MVIKHLESSLIDAEVALDPFDTAVVHLQTEMTKAEKFPLVLHKRPFLNARSLVQSLFDIQKFLALLPKLSQDSQGIDDANNEFSNQLPDLKGVRDSEQHMDERIQGLVKGKKMPTSKMWFGNLMTNSYEMTMANGRIGRIEISRKALDISAMCNQGAINSFDWIGHPEEMTVS